MAFGYAFSCGPRDHPGGTPVTLSAGSDDVQQVLEGPVARKVTRVTISLAGGSVVNLRPVAWQGERWVAVLLPTALRVTEAVAFSRPGDLGRAVPLVQGQTTTFGRWLHPDQPAHGRVTYLLGSGSINGTAWSQRL
ncbi:MAG: hypothetical protein ACLPUO_08050 [Streptosporangiaceae bacterium]